MKPKAAVFAFTSCEGCSLMILSMEDELLGLLDKIEFVNFREAIDDKRDDYDIAIIDGAISREHEIEELKKIRENAKLLIAMGACAVQGGLYALKNFHDPIKTVEYVYGDMAGNFDSIPVKPISAYVKVDYNLYGCPMDKREFLEVITSILVGRTPNIPNYPICNECRMAENICVFDRGKTCLGPITRAGCGAICPAHATGCCGCRGPLDKAAFEQHRAIMREHGVSLDEVMEQFREFNGCWEETHEKP